MRREDAERLSQPYRPDDTTEPDDRLGVALGLRLESVRSLRDAVLGNLDDKNYGVGWWAPHPGTSRRILISDHLLQCVVSIGVNLVEAKLHLLELADWQERQQRFLARSVKLDGHGRPVVAHPPRESPSDDLMDVMADLHIAGFFRAVGSTMDCLGGALIGVLGLKTDILRSDMDKARKALKQISAPTTPGEQIQANARNELDQLVVASGPHGWLDWATDYRNMLVHRGRRLHLGKLELEALVFGPDGRKVPRSTPVRLLAQDPGLSDIEAMTFLSKVLPVLGEDSRVTLDGLLASANQFAEGMSALLLRAWNARRATPSLIPQPREQWPKVPASSSRGFQGYAPGTQKLDATMLQASPSLLRRIVAASLHDPAHKDWAGFD